MRVAELTNIPFERGVAIAAIVIALTLWAGWPYIRRRRPKCLLSPLEVRAHDTVEALTEMEEAMTALQEQKRSLPNELLPAWVKAKTAGVYLRRFLEQGR